jgi:hypothetical protein
MVVMVKVVRAMVERSLLLVVVELELLVSMVLRLLVVMVVLVLLPQSQGHL